jgi:hypothetical protein
LLAHAEDRTPIVGEVKYTKTIDSEASHKKTSSDKDPFSAVVQALAVISQLVNPSQYLRLDQFGRAAHQHAGLRDAASPVFDAYVVLHNPSNGTFLEELGEETRRLSALLLTEPAVARSVRRIACLTTTRDDDLRVETEFAYERSSPQTEPVERAFADYFRPWGLRLPDAAVLDRADGAVLAKGWVGRWRWHWHALEFRAAHRMTNERWHVIEPDGTLTNKPVPPEMMVYRPGEDRSEVEAAY